MTATRGGRVTVFARLRHRMLDSGIADHPVDPDASTYDGGEEADDIME